VRYQGKKGSRRVGERAGGEVAWTGSTELRKAAADAAAVRMLGRSGAWEGCWMVGMILDRARRRGVVAQKQRERLRWEGSWELAGGKAPDDDWDDVGCTGG
jgi:hypothetical protein